MVSSPCPGGAFPKGLAAGPQGMPPPPFEREKRVVAKRFDRDEDGRLSLSERDRARVWLKQERANSGPPRPQGPPPGSTRAAAAQPGPFPRPDEFPHHSAKNLFDPTILRTFFLTFERPNWEEELEDFYDTDVEVPATLEVDGQGIGEVGVRFRGMSSYAMVERGHKRSLNVSFDAFSPGRRFHGAKTMNLLNSAHDPTFLRTVLFSELARRYVPTPAANHVRVVINGESFGVYVNSQQFDAEFTEEWFHSRLGHRFKAPGSPKGRASLAYLGEAPEPYQEIYRYKGPDPEAGYRQLIRLCRVLAETPLDQLESALMPLLDLDETIAYLALDNVLLNSDGYLVRTSDYNLYQAESGRFILVSHDTNETFDALDRGPGHERSVEIDPLFGADDPEKPLLSRLLGVPNLRRRYLSRVHQFARELLDPVAIRARIAQAQALLGDAVKADNKKLFDTDSFWRGASENLWRQGPCGREIGYGILPFVEARRRYLLQHPALLPVEGG